MKKALVLYAASEIGPPHFSGDLLWRSGFRAPDPLFLVEIDGKTYLLASPLEVERAAKESKVDEVVTIAEYAKRTPEKTDIQGLVAFLREKGIRVLVVPSDFPYEPGKELEEQFIIESRKPPFYPERAVKTEWEIGEIEKAQRAVEHAVGRAHEFLSECLVREDRIYDGPVLVTSEAIRKIIDGALFARGYLGVSTIVASGIQAADPHCAGWGPLVAHSAIVIDVFPLSFQTHYYADQTRTVFKGEPSRELIKMYETVLAAQLQAIAMMRTGVNGKDVMNFVVEYFEAQGYPTDITRRPMEGFFHGFGHGVGIDIHEPPRINSRGDILQAGNVVTAEPGLYYSTARGHIPVGGIRIEDMGVVERDGFRNLTRMPKNLSWAIIP